MKVTCILFELTENVKKKNGYNMKQQSTIHHIHVTLFEQIVARWSGQFMVIFKCDK